MPTLAGGDNSGHAMTFSPSQYVTAARRSARGSSRQVASRAAISLICVGLKVTSAAEHAAKKGTNIAPHLASQLVATPESQLPSKSLQQLEVTLAAKVTKSVALHGSTLCKPRRRDSSPRLWLPHIPQVLSQLPESKQLADNSPLISRNNNSKRHPEVENNSEQVKLLST